MAIQTMVTGEQIEDFLAEKRFAIVGVSRNASDFSRTLFAELRRRGYDPIPVNPAANEIEGIRCYARVQNITPPVKAVLIMVPPKVAGQVVRECAEANVRHVWLHQGAGIGAVSSEAIEFCNEHGIRVIPGYCPYMFLSHAGLIHRAHGLVMKLTGVYPN